MASSSDNNVSFRLDPECMGVLEERARRADVSVHKAAKKIVIDAIENGAQTDQTAERLGALEAQVSELRNEVAVAVETLLIAAGRLKPEQARQWVKDNLGDPP